MILPAIFTKLLTIASALWCNLPLILVALFGVGFLIAFHELGHLIFAKLFNVYAPSFSIGFGPRLLQFKWGETTYALSLIPLGGYVELAGSEEMGQGEQTHAKDISERSFASKPYWQKLLIMLGGIGFNILFAYVALSLLYTQGAPCFGTMCNDKPAYIGAIHQGAAQKAGLLPGDTIIAVAGESTPNVEALTKALRPHIEKPVALTILRNNKEVPATITPDGQTIGEETRPLLGLNWEEQKMPFLDALKAGWQGTWAMIVQVAGALKNLTKSRKGLGGPLMLICKVTQFAGFGFKMFLFILALISVNLAVFNVLPLPIFDGGQVLFFSIEAILGRPLSEKARHNIHYYTWLFVIALVIYLTLKDAITLSGWV